jgi:hypothetical protein
MNSVLTSLYLQGVDSSSNLSVHASRRYRIVAIKGTSDVFPIIDDLRMYTEIVLFQILQSIMIFYTNTIGLVVKDSTFIRILNVTIAPKDMTASPEVKDCIRACLQRSVELGYDVTLTGHSLGGGLALHLANEWVT